jgi:hypothetical protein
MFQTTINPTILENFRANLHGELIMLGDATYDSARRVWNGMIDKHPALIARCADSADVASAVQFARDQNLEVAVDTALRATERVTEDSSSTFPP